MFEEIKRMYYSGNIIIRLIFINVAVFLIINIIGLFSFLFTGAGTESLGLINWLAVPADLGKLLYRPWTLITYAFLHYDFLHILFNMLWLYWFGKIFLEFLSSKQLLSLYLLGGISGAALYILAYNVFPAFSQAVPYSYALGASAAVYAVVIAIAAFVPDYSIILMFIGRVQIKYIAIFVVVLDLLSISGGNAGGHIAHLGGALFGFLFATQIRSGSDITAWFGKLTNDIAAWFKSKPKMRVTENKFKNKPTADIKYNQQKAADQEVIDKILEKISKSGYNSLSKKEKEILFKMSNKK
ncbi:MAG: rhomboid family intramembrane serine protease [Bacteroidales bacterium]|nr:rhomboid family intramembrane serine protease [Bacteroidales bacterium]